MSAHLPESPTESEARPDSSLRFRCERLLAWERSPWRDGGMLDALAFYGSEGEIRARVLAWAASTRIDGFCHGVARVQRFLDGGRDAELGRAARLGVRIGGLLGTHELVLHAARATARAQLGAGNAGIDEAAWRLLESMPRDAVVAAQAAFVASGSDVGLAECAGTDLPPARIPLPEPLPPPAFARVDRALLLLGRAALGPAAPGGWLPALAQVDADGDDGRACLAALRRWEDGLRRVLADVRKESRNRPFRQIAGLWLRSGGGGIERTRDTERRPFSLDLVGRATDAVLVRTWVLSGRHDVEACTWVLNEWQLSRELLSSLAFGAGWGGQVRQGVVWVHHALFGGRRTLDAFKKAVSVAGLVPWCLAEIDAAVHAARPAGRSTGSWRARCAGRVPSLPAVPWPASRLDPERPLAWLVEIFREHPP